MELCFAGGETRDEMSVRKRVAAAAIIILMLVFSYVQANYLLQTYCIIKHKLCKEQMLRLLSAHGAVIRRKWLKKRKQCEYWVAPGRTSVWWENFMSGLLIDTEWKNNFRMTRRNFFKLCENLGPMIE